MKDCNSLAFVYGVVKQYVPDGKSKALRLHQAALKGHKWWTWFVVGDTPLEDDSFTEPNLYREDPKRFETFFQRSHEITESQLTEELDTLYEYAVQSPTDTDNWWNFAHVSFKKVFEYFLDSPCAHCPPRIEAFLSLVEVILFKASHARRKSVPLFQSFVRTCCATCRLLLMQREVLKAQSLSNLIAMVQWEIEEEEKFQEDLEEGELSTADLVYLTAACCDVLCPTVALHNLNKVQRPLQPHTVSCFRVCLLHDVEEYDRALDVSSALTEDSVYQTLSPKLRSQLCDLVGSCYYNTGMYYASVDWFGKAAYEDSSNVSSLWNVANAYRKLENVGAERAALRVMAQGALSRPRTVTSRRWFDHQALYILATRLESAGLSEEAAEHFDDFINKRFFWEDCEWGTLVAKPTMAQVHVQAAHARLHAGLYQECTDILKSVLADSLETNAELKPGLFGDFVGRSADCCATVECASAQGTSCLALLLKAVAQMRMQEGPNEEAENTLRRILSVVSLVDKVISTSEENKVVNQETAAETGCDAESHRKWLEMVSQVYCNLSVLRLRRDLKVDALHSLKASLMAWPDNLDSLYNYVLLLLKMDKIRKATQVWNSAVERSLRCVLEKVNVSYWNFNVTLAQLKELNGIVSRN